MIKLLIGGSPCTYWSIAQKKNRETEPSGIGWELFENYLIAKEKFKPDFFLYENNKSAAQAIKDEIKKRLNVYDSTLFMPDSGARYIEINSALVSAQNRQRFYVHNCGDVGQPEDRGVLLRDILETGTDLTQNEKAYCLTATYNKAVPRNTIERKQRTMVADPICLNSKSGRKVNGVYKENLQPSLQDRIYSIDGKSTAVTAAFMPKIAEPVNTINGKSKTLRASYYKDGVRNLVGNNIDRKTCVAEPVRIGDIGSTAQVHRVYSCDGKSVTINAGGGGQGGKTGLYDCPVMRVREATKQGFIEIMPGECVDLSQENSKTRRGRAMKDKSNCLTTSNEFYEYCGTIDKPIYKVENGKIEIKGKEYPIKLKDGYYIIRKLTVTECCRLQTLPDKYCRTVSKTQAYKGLGNGWMVEVIIHILNGALKDVPRDERIVVLSMYDGIGTGRYCLDKMGFTNVEYHAFEIDKYAMQIAKSNYPDIIEHGDAYQVRDGLNFIYGVQTLYRYHDRNKFHQNGDNV